MSIILSKRENRLKMNINLNFELTMNYNKNVVIKS